MNHFFFIDRHSYKRHHNKKEQMLLRNIIPKGHELPLVLDTEYHGIMRAHGFSRTRNVLYLPSVINHARAIINSERKRAVSNNSLTYVKGWGKYIAYAIKIASVCERHHLSRAYARLNKKTNVCKS